jgi:hypothetical protein
MSKLATALVLCDVPAHGLKAGQLLEASAETIKLLAMSGEVDPHKSAVDAATKAGAHKVRSTAEQPAG